MFENLQDKLQGVFEKLSSRGKLSEADVDVALREVRLALLEADVNFKVVKDFVQRVRERAVGAEVMRSLTPAQQVIKIVHEELIATLGEPARLNLSGPSPHVIMLVGLQGSGKTTTAAKLALNLRQAGQRPLMVAADTRRPAAITQIEVLGKQLDIPVHSEGNKVPPPQICANALKRAREAAYSVVLLDTAGRLHIDDELMGELEQVKARTDPQEVLLVVDAMTGQDAVRVADEFNKRVGVTGLILTKVDGDARGGAAISVRSVTGVPIKFMGVGEKTDALEVFYPDRLASRILGMGDMLTAIEKAQQVMDQDQAVRMGERLVKGEFNLEDFRDQLQELKKMGPLSQLLDMIPGMSQLTRDLQPDVTDQQMKVIEAIINSMTIEERRSPRVINGSRKRRIARGSGTSVTEVNDLLSQFRQMQRLMKQMGGGGKRGGRGGMRGLLSMLGGQGG
ncbi:MAG: signal recognition particle protein [Anaerolineae bacterium]|nr:signal recognition particle protein [Anaerolineae bacterium]MDX9831831.1 signal recognition particle protein [Anaerolineae bacterium]